MQTEFEELTELADRRGFAVERSGAKFTILDRDGDEVWDRVSFDMAKGFLKARPLKGERTNATKRNLMEAAKIRGFWIWRCGAGLYSISEQRDHMAHIMDNATPDAIMEFLKDKVILPAASARRVA